MAKKYYWLKLKKDFFKRHDIRIVEEMPNGKDYILFYLKMLLESIDHDGELRFSETIPYNDQMLSIITNTNIDIVKSAMQVFIELKMIEIFDDSTIYMNEVQKLIGSETAGAERTRKHREKQKLLQCNALVTKCNTEIEKEEEKELHIDIEKKKKINYQQVADLYNDTCVSFPKLKSLSETRKKSIKARLNTYSFEQIKEVFVKAEASDFLKGSNSRNWQANFDWLMKDGNFAKVLDGNYDNKPVKNGDKRKASYNIEELEEIHVIEPPVTVADDENLKARAEKLKKEIQQKKGW